MPGNPVKDRVDAKIEVSPKASRQPEGPKIDGLGRSLVAWADMFKETLRDLVEKTDGGIAGLIMDSEGIALESYSRDGSTFDINTIGIEFGVVLGQIKRASESLDAGAAREVAISTDKVVTLIRTLTDQYFLAVAMRPEGNFGKARFLVRTAMPKLLQELG